MTEVDTIQLIANAVGGDLDAFQALLDIPYSRMQPLTSLVPDLVVTKEGLLRVLLAFQKQTVSAELIHQWAWLVRGGRFGSSANPIQTLHIRYAESLEEEIAEIVSRLTELGDLVDGEISGEELAKMIDTLRSDSKLR